MLKIPARLKNLGILETFDSAEKSLGLVKFRLGGKITWLTQTNQNITENNRHGSSKLVLNTEPGSVETQFCKLRIRLG